VPLFTLLHLHHLHFLVLSCPYFHSRILSALPIRSIYAIDTVTADTEIGLVIGFAWLIYFNIVMTEQLETETPDLRLKTETEDRDRD